MPGGELGTQGMATLVIVAPLLQKGSTRRDTAGESHPKYKVGRKVDCRGVGEAPRAQAASVDGAEPIHPGRVGPSTTAGRDPTFADLRAEES